MAISQAKIEELRQFKVWAEPLLKKIEFGKKGNAKDYWILCQAELKITLGFNVFYSRIKRLENKRENIVGETVTRICPKCHRKYKTKLGRDGLPLHNRCKRCKGLEKGCRDVFYRTV